MHNPISKFLKNKLGFSNVLTAIITVVVAAILIIVAALIISSVNDSLPAVTGEANTTITNVVSGAYDALNLLQIVLIVLAASAIIAAVIGGFMYMRSRE